ncbi:MAG TPA: hypothetical protein GXX30_01590 [Firmicutes bacterium]|nr:hypothetical protein [Candidatus Fermentithermobacillaceae bacterium]
MDFATIGTWLQAIFTILLISVVFKDNPAYRFAENTYVGLYAGYFVVIRWFNYIRPNITENIIKKGMWWYIFPILIGLMIYTRYIKPIAWISRYNICFLLGIGSGYIIATSIKPLFVDQIRATFLPLWVAGDWWNTVSNWVYVVGTVASLVYFFFTVEKKGVQGKISAIGRWTMMVAFGAAFGNTVMARVSLFLGRMQFLLGDWLKLL